MASICIFHYDLVIPLYEIRVRPLGKMCIYFTLDPCANIDCGIPFGTNRCVDGRCVCGSLSGACPATTPVCFGSGEDATCSCHTGSCIEPNPVCDSDGKCKVRCK